jgi:hypothetical protein
MLLAEVALAAAALLDAADDRMLGADATGVAYDHAAAEAGLVAAGCLESAAEGNVDGALEILRVALDALSALPVPTGQDVLRLLIRAELRRRGHDCLPAFLQAVA